MWRVGYLGRVTNECETITCWSDDDGAFVAEVPGLWVHCPRRHTGEGIEAYQVQALELNALLRYQCSNL